MSCWGKGKETLQEGHIFIFRMSSFIFHSREMSHTSSVQNFASKVNARMFFLSICVKLLSSDKLLLCENISLQSTSSLESNLEGLAGVLEADLPNYKSKILRILCAVYVHTSHPLISNKFCKCVLCGGSHYMLSFVDSARLLPEKLTVYTTLVGLLNARNYNFGGEFVEAMIRQLKETLKNNLYSEAVYLVCWLL